MNYYFAKCSELNLLLCIKTGLWKHQTNTMKKWKPKDILILYTETGIAGLFEVTSKQFVDLTRIWTDKIYPYRVNINPLKILSPENRISLTEHNIKTEMAEKYGKMTWGLKLSRHLKPLDSQIAKRIEKIIQEKPHYDPYSSIEGDIKTLSETTSIQLQKGTKILKKDIVDLPPKQKQSLYISLRDRIEKIGKWEGKYTETEYTIGNLGKIDVVWKKNKNSNPLYAFEVRLKGNFYKALAKLKHAFDLWNSIPVLVTTEQYFTQAEEQLSDSFHEMKNYAKIINYEKIRELYSIEKKRNQLKEELELDYLSFCPLCSLCW